MNDNKTSWKEKQFEILCRIDEICRQYGIDLYLCDSTALMAYRSGEVSDSVFVAIESKDAYRFIDAVGNNSKYGVRGMFNYFHYAAFDIKVYDEDTIDFDLATFRNYGFCGLHVTVKLIRHLPDKDRERKSYQRGLDVYRRYISTRYDNLEVDTSRRLRFQLLLGRLPSKKAFNEEFFRINIKRYSKDTKKIQIGSAICDADVFRTKKKVYINGREFYMAGDAPKYFESRYGENWENHVVGEYKERNYQFRDAEHSWEELQEYIDYLDFKDYYYKRDISRNNIEKNRPNERYWQRDKYLVERSHLRFVFWQKYMPVKEKIIELHNAGKTEELQELLQPYLAQLERFAGSRMSIYFDKEIFDIALDIFRAEGKERVVDRLVNNIPPEHLGELRIKNSRGEYTDVTQH